MKIPTAEELAAAAPMEAVEPRAGVVPPPPPPRPLSTSRSRSFARSSPPPSPFYRPERLSRSAPPPAFYEPEVAAAEPPPSPFDCGAGHRRRAPPPPPFFEPEPDCSALRSSPPARRPPSSRSRYQFVPRPLLLRLRRSTSPNRRRRRTGEPRSSRDRAGARAVPRRDGKPRADSDRGRPGAAFRDRSGAPSRAGPGRGRGGALRRGAGGGRRGDSGDAGGRGARVSTSCPRSRFRQPRWLRRRRRDDPGGRSGGRRGGVGRAVPGDGRARSRWRSLKPRPGTKVRSVEIPPPPPELSGGPEESEGTRAHHPRHRGRPRGVRVVRAGDAPPRDLGAARRPHRRGDPGRHRHPRVRPGGGPAGFAMGEPSSSELEAMAAAARIEDLSALLPLSAGPMTGAVVAPPRAAEAMPGTARSSRLRGERAPRPSCPTPTSTGSPVGSSSFSPTRPSATSPGRSCRSTPSVSFASGSPRSRQAG